MAELLAIVEVDEPNKIRCQAHGCGRGVWRRIHVVADGESLTVIGSDCYAQLYGGAESGQVDPAYGNAAGVRLTDEARELLIANTEAFVERMRSEHEAELRKQAERQAAELAAMEEERLARFNRLQEATSRFTEAQQERDKRARQREDLDAAVTGFNPERRTAIAAEVRHWLTSTYSIDLRLPGWAGWYNVEVRKRIIAELAASRAVAVASPATVGAVAPAHAEEGSDAPQSEAADAVQGDLFG